MGLRLSCVLGLVLVSLPAWAAPLDEAKAEFAAGKEAFERGEYENALSHYHRADQLVPAASLQYNIGTCNEHLSRYGEAAGAFERYLEMSGSPTTDDEREFQEKLRARIAANRKRAADLQPPPPPPQVYGAPPPTYYVPPLPPPPPREQLLAQARARRGRAIALMVVGLSLDLIGTGLGADGLTNRRGCNACSYGEDFIGVTAFIVGVTLWAPGASSYVGAQRQINELTKESPQPHAFLFHSPVFRF